MLVIEELMAIFDGELAEYGVVGLFAWPYSGC
jgi:hypothetical protein